ncbi:hypothetical protein CcI6DRAFT_03729 [Frankia sp. CcI6]|nr:hypothetical protein CcI6DRAFT_03729 [Frankia sp. CcI6]OHV47181.1 hypothetical protein CgIS1_22275 [Frankia sp. CgIS1]
MPVPVLGYRRVMHTISPQDQGRLTQAVEARETDVQQAKAIILRAVEGGSALGADGLVIAVLTAAGADLNAFRTPVHPRELGEDPLDAELPPLKLARIRAAAREALADLVAAGILTSCNTPGTLPVQVHDGGYGTTAQLPLSEPLLAPAYRVARRYRGVSELAILDPTLGTDGLKDLLGPRGLKALVEAVETFRAGRYFSSSNMLALASEAAWFSVAETMRADKPQIDKLLDDPKTPASTLIERVVPVLKDLGAKKSRVDELHRFADSLRGIRDYALHPRATLDSDYEARFAEAPAYLLLVEGRRYLRNLRQATLDAGLQF